MMLFWISTAVISLLACAVVVYPLLKPNLIDEEAERDELNKAFFNDRLAELEAEDDTGIVTDKQALVLDLQQSLLDDIPHQSAPLASNYKLALAKVAVPAVVFMLLLTYGMYFKFGAADKVLHWQQVEANLPELSKKLMDPRQPEMTPQELDDLTLALRTRLQHVADDATGWLLLGRIAMANRDTQTAIGAMKNADRLAPNDSGVQLSYAQALMFSGDPADQQQAEQILDKLAQAGGQVDLRVYSLKAFNAYENGDFASAIEYWRKMLAVLPSDDSRTEMLQRSIAAAQKQMQATSAPITSSTSVPVQSVAGTAVNITISLTEDVPLPKQGMLMVSIHSADGAPMPIAAARYPLDHFPVTVVMDDNNSMLKERKLSSLNDIMVRARIDSDGNVGISEHDWYGESHAYTLGEDVTVTINQHY